MLVGRRRNHLEEGTFAAEGTVEALARLLLNADRARGVRLWVEIDEERGDFFLGQSSGEIDGGGGFTDAAFLVGDGEDSSGHEEKLG